MTGKFIFQSSWHTSDVGAATKSRRKCMVVRLWSFIVIVRTDYVKRDIKRWLCELCYRKTKQNLNNKCTDRVFCQCIRISTNIAFLPND